MSESKLRRSSRRREKKPDSKFSVGMVVEVSRLQCAALLIRKTGETEKAAILFMSLTHDTCLLY